MFCTKCGTQLPDGSVFCTNCGNKLAEGQPNQNVNQGAAAQGQQQPNQGGQGQQPYQAPYSPQASQQTNMQMPSYGESGNAQYGNYFGGGQPPEKKKKSKAPIFIGIGITLIIAIVAVVLFIVLKDKDTDDEPSNKKADSNTEETTPEESSKSEEDDTSKKEDPTKPVASMNVNTAKKTVENFMSYADSNNISKAARLLYPAMKDMYNDQYDMSAEDIVEDMLADITNSDGDIIPYKLKNVDSSEGFYFSSLYSNYDSYIEPVAFAEAELDFDSDEATGNGYIEIVLCEDGSYYITECDFYNVELGEEKTSDNNNLNEGDNIVDGDDMSDLFTDSAIELSEYSGIGTLTVGDGFTFEVPKNWKEVTAGIVKQWYEPNLTTNINYVVDDTYGNYGAHTYFSAALQQLSAIGAKDIEMAKFTMGEIYGVVTAYDIENGGVEMEGWQFSFIDGDRVVIFTITTSDSDSTTFDAALDAVQTVKFN